MTTLTLPELTDITLAAGLLALAALVALQPLMWRDPVPTAAQIYADHRGNP